MGLISGQFDKLYLQVQINKIFECKIVSIFLPISFNIPWYVVGAQKTSHWDGFLSTNIEK